MYRNLFVKEELINEYGMGFLRHLCLRSIFSVIKKQKPDECIIACDGQGNWRKKIYPKYKEHRKDARDKHDIEWDAVFDFLDEFINEMIEIFPFIVIKQKHAEADDVIATICMEYNDDEYQNIIISNDKDFKYLLYYGAELYDPMKNEFVTCKNPKRFLKELILQGDKSDNVPGFAPQIGPKRAEKYAENPAKLKAKISEDAEYKKNLRRNQALISPEYIPDVLQDSILKKYRKARKKNIFVDSDMTMLEYLKSKKLNALLDDLATIEPYVNVLAKQLREN